MTAVLLWWLLRLSADDKDYVRLTKFMKTNARKISLKRDHLKNFGGTMRSRQDRKRRPHEGICVFETDPHEEGQSAYDNCHTKFLKERVSEAVDIYFQRHLEEHRKKVKYSTYLLFFKCINASSSFDRLY